jgi:hypothetical protein
MHAQPRLLNALVDYWHPDAEAFMLEGQSLVPTTEDIYFLTGLSRRGEPVNFQTFPAGPSKISELVAEYCEAGTEHRGSSVPVSRITSLPLQTILSLIGQDYRLSSRASGFARTDELCDPVHECTNF